MEMDLKQDLSKMTELVESLESGLRRDADIINQMAGHLNRISHIIDELCPELRFMHGTFWAKKIVRDGKMDFIEKELDSIIGRMKKLRQTRKAEAKSCFEGVITLDNASHHVLNLKAKLEKISQD